MSARSRKGVTASDMRKYIDSISQSEKSTLEKVPDGSAVFTKGGDEKITLNDESGHSLVIDRASFRNSLTELKKYATTHSSALPADVINSAQRIVDILKTAYKDEASHAKLLDDIKHYFSDQAEPSPNTLAAFLTGCQNNTGFPYNLGCNPRCVGGAKPLKGTADYSACKDLVLIYENQILSVLNDQHSEHAYIYVPDRGFIGFDPMSVKRLKESEVSTVTIIIGNKTDGSYNEIRDKVPVDELPIVVVDQTNGGSAANDSTTENNSSAALIWTIVILLILIVILLAVWYYNTYYRS